MTTSSTKSASYPSAHASQVLANPFSAPRPPRLANKVALVTGSTQGIGAAIVRVFLAEGAQVVISARSNNAETSALLEEAGAARAIFIPADMGKNTDIDNLIAQSIKAFGRLDVVVNNAGMNVFNDPLLLNPDEWQKCMSVDLEGAWYCTRAALPDMLSRQAGSIINIASVHGHKIIPNCFPYPVAKHALIGLTRALGIQYAAQGIRVNSISPGLIWTPAIERWLATVEDRAAVIQQQEQLLPCRRIGTADEVAYTAVLLASDEARFINATDILIDGGRSQIYHD